MSAAEPSATLPSEQELIRRCRHGEPDAWDTLFDLHYDAVGRYVFQLMPSFRREDVQEVCQETFLSVVRRLASFASRSRLQTWIFRIAANKARDYVEHQRAVKRGGGQTPVSIHAADPDSGLTLDPPSASPGPEAGLMAREQLEQMREALDMVGEPCREIIELRYFADLSYQEIGDILALNLKTVSSRLSKCLDKLEIALRDLMGRESSPRPSV